PTPPPPAEAWTIPPAEEQDRCQSGNCHHVGVFGEKEHRELHAAIFGVPACNELLLRLREVKGQPVGLGDTAEEIHDESNGLKEDVPLWNEPEPCSLLALDDIG